MYRIGEFSKIAQVSGRLLRYYDEIGLLQPTHTDRETGYRYYSAKQLPRLNRILALKELGLSLEQVARLLDDDISADEIRGMLMMKKAQIEQTLLEEINRFKVVESRLKQVEDEGALIDFDIVVKSVPRQQFLAVREVCPGFPEGRRLLQEMRQLLPATVSSKRIENYMAIVHSEFFEQEDIDLEVGVVLAGSTDVTPTLSDQRTMTIRELPAVDMMASVVRVGDPSVTSHLCYSALGAWVEENGYAFAGEGREVFIDFPDTSKTGEAVTEIQFPIRKLNTDVSFLLS